MPLISRDHACGGTLTGLAAGTRLLPARTQAAAFAVSSAPIPDTFGADGILVGKYQADNKLALIFCRPMAGR